MNIKLLTRLCAGSACMLLLMANQGGCDADTAPTSAERDQQVTEQLANQAVNNVGWPGITNFTEKRQLKMLYELRDNPNLVTYSYYLDLNGGKHKVCPTTSLGYGIPYATQYTNAQRPVWHNYDQGTAGVTIAQPEPNGLFPPAAAEGTWVICLAPDGKSLEPVYVEPRVLVSQFPMKSVD